jgi:hypothetical protein
MASLEAAKKGSFKYDAARTRVETKLSDEMVASLKMVGLEDWEIEVCQEWAGLSTMAGVSEECRYAKWVLDKAPLPDKLGLLDKERFWEQMGLGERLDFFWEALHFREQFPEPKTVVGGIALKVIRHWMAFAEKNWPDAADLYRAARSKSGKKSGETVGLATLWRTAMDLERVWHGRGHRPQVNPEDVYEALGPLKPQVEVDCWTRDDGTMLELLRKKHDGHGCSFCDLYSLDGYGFGWSSDGTTTCPRCSFGLLHGRIEAPERVPWDGGPTAPERGGYAYRWAVRHGYMWDEFLEKVAGGQTGFDPLKKTLCPLLDRCDTRCAQDQQSGVRGWPLGSSDYESSCYKFREIVWCQENAGTPEQFKEAERRRLERLTNDMKKKDRERRRAAKEEPVTVGAAEEPQPAEEHPGEPVQMSLL